MPPSTNPHLEIEGVKSKLQAHKFDSGKNDTLNNTHPTSSVNPPPGSGKSGALAAGSKISTNPSQLPRSNSASASVSTSTVPKYAKIQPAIAIKPKPVAANGAAAGPPKSKFNPRYQPTSASSPSRQVFSAEESLSANINTSKKWVLPPRPRPGRKPSAAANGGSGLSDDERKSSTHKKHKCSRAEAALENPIHSMARSMSSSPPPCGSMPSTPQNKSHSMATGSTPMTASASAGSIGWSANDQKRLACVKPKSEASPSHSSPITNREILSAPGLSKDQEGAQSSATSQKRVTDLQKTYLAKLKEQELVHNYIDILTNQIKELKFVQSGVITFDALNSGSSSKPQTPLTPPPDQLDHINNVRDLDAFLAHLTTQSNVIHSVTKKFVGDSSKEGSHLQSQIKHYLDLKANHGKSRSSLNNRNDSKVNNEQASITSNLENSKLAASNPQASKPHESIKELLSSNTEMEERYASNKKHDSFFTSSFLRPLNMNLFEQEDGMINVDIINERDPFSGSVGSIEKKQLDSVAEGDLDALNGGNEFRQSNTKVPKKIGCGFCSPDNPCLCFDADNVFGEK